MAVVPPLQKASAEGVAITSGVGCTVTSKLNVGPTQNVEPGPVGVITYLTTPVVVPLFTNVWLMVAGHPDKQSLNPVMLPPVGGVRIDAVQVKVVPVTAEVGV